MSKDIYEENKRLRARIERMEREESERVASSAQAAKDVSDLLVRGVGAFLKGNASLVIEPGNDSGHFSIRFRGPDSP